MTLAHKRAWYSMRRALMTGFNGLTALP